jgi:hypothetical protein
MLAMVAPVLLTRTVPAMVLLELARVCVATTEYPARPWTFLVKVTWLGLVLVNVQVNLFRVAARTVMSAVAEAPHFTVAVTVAVLLTGVPLVSCRLLVVVTCAPTAPHSRPQQKHRQHMFSFLSTFVGA